MAKTTNGNANSSKWELWKRKCEMTWDASPAIYWSVRQLIEEEYTPCREKMLSCICYAHTTITNPDNPRDSFAFPLIHNYNDCAATAFDDKENNGLLLDLALRAIRCFSSGDSIVYLFDSDITGDFNKIDRIIPASGNLQYVTRENDIDNILLDLMEQTEQNRKIINIEVSDVMSHNSMSPDSFIPLRFLFIRNIESTLSYKQIGLLTSLIQNNNATKAGIYVFFSYTGNPKEYKGTLKRLIDMSSLIAMKPVPFSNTKPTSIESPTIQDIKDISAWLEHQTQSKIQLTFNEWIETALNSNTLWQDVSGSSNHQLSIPVGYTPDMTIQEVEFRFSSGCPHSYVAGKSGYGKTILLHNLIINGAIKYSPNQLQFYLLDLKGAGLSFNYYRQLPHVAALSMENDRTFAVSVLQKLLDENQNRAKMFAKQKVTKLDDYNDIAQSKHLPTLPYIMCIIDEYQELFRNYDSKASETTKLLQQILKQGRSQGIILILCTQKPESEGMGDPSNIANRISLHLDLPYDSTALLGNTAATKLSNAGDAILKTTSVADKSPKHNISFHVANIDERHDLPHYVEELYKIHLELNKNIDPLKHLVFDGAKISKNPSWLNSGTQKIIFLGAPRFCREEHISIRFHHNSRNNVLIVGNDRNAALRLISLISYQFLRLYDQGQVFITDMQNNDEPTYRALSFLTKGSHNIKLSSRETLSEMTNSMFEEISHRTTTPGTYSEMLFTIIDYKQQHFDKDTLKKLKAVVCNGPNVGIHSIVYGYNSNNLSNMLYDLQMQLSSQFEIKIGLKGGEPAKSFSDTFSSAELVDKTGCAQIVAPSTMLGEKRESKFGYPFQIYDEFGNDKIKDATLTSIFSILQSPDDYDIN